MLIVELRTVVSVCMCGCVCACGCGCACAFACVKHCLGKNEQHFTRRGKKQTKQKSCSVQWRCCTTGVVDVSVLPQRELHALHVVQLLDKARDVPKVCRIPHIRAAVSVGLPRRFQRHCSKRYPGHPKLFDNLQHPCLVRRLFWVVPQPHCPLRGHRHPACQLCVLVQHVVVRRAGKEVEVDHRVGKVHPADPRGWRRRRRQGAAARTLCHNRQVLLVDARARVNACKCVADVERTAVLAKACCCNVR